MITQVKDVLNKSLNDLRDMQSLQEKRLGILTDRADLILREKARSSGRKYYCARRTGERRAEYLGSSESDAVNEVREARYLKTSLMRIDSNIKEIERLMSNLKGVSYEEINLALPAAYRNPKLSYSASNSGKAAAWKNNKLNEKLRYGVHKPDELKIRTDDGEYVRSKSEGMIYNHLLNKGVTFVYEMPTIIDGSMYLPDFTLLSEIDYKTEILIEHQGMMTNEEYRERFFEKMYRYMRGGYVQGLNVFYTFDTLEGGLDKSPIDDIIATRIRLRNV